MSKRQGVVLSGSGLSLADSRPSSLTQHRRSRLRSSGANLSLNSLIDEQKSSVEVYQEPPSREDYRKQTIARLTMKCDRADGGGSGSGSGGDNKENRRIPRKDSTKFNSLYMSQPIKIKHEQSAADLKRVSLKALPEIPRSETSVTPLAQLSSQQMDRKKRSTSNRLSLASLHSLSSSLSSKSAGSKLKSMAHKLRQSEERLDRSERSDSEVHDRPEVSAAQIGTQQPSKQTVAQTQDPTDPTAPRAPTQSEVPSLKKKTSRFRLRHSISLRRLTGIYQHDSANTSSSAAADDAVSLSSQHSLSHKISLTELGRSLRFLAGGSDSDDGSAATGAMAGTLSRRASSINLSKCDISLPVVQHETREKLNNRLRNSSSILSISSFISTNSAQSGDSGTAETQATRASELGEINQRLLLKLCNQSRVVSFETFYERLAASSARKIDHLTQTNFSDIYVEKTADGKPTSVFKVIPFGDIHSEQMLPTEVIQELSITMAMTPIDGFVRLKFAKVVHGPYPKGLVNPSNVSGNGKRYGEYSAGQLFLVIRMEYAGVDLEHYQVKSWADAYNIVLQTAHILARGEEQHEFEHRDLHWGNLAIKDGQVRLLDFTLSRAKVGQHVVFTGLDNPNFFKGKGDYLFTTYRLMREMLDENWSDYCPGTNVLWIHYLLDRLINHKSLKPVRVNPITRSNRSTASEEKRMAAEVASCNRLLTAYKALDPTRKSKHRGKKGGNRRKRRGSRTLEDFSTAGEFAQWFEEKA